MSSKSLKTDDMSREDLVAKVTQMEAHIFQLKHIIAKQNGSAQCSEREKKQRKFDFNKYNTRHVALKIVYLGWDYQGFAVQEDTNNTIEAALFTALNRTKLIESRETSHYHRCGRTDKGVSAFGQVISIDLRTNLLDGLGVKQREGGTAADRPGDKTEEISFVKILNKVLPPEIKVLAWCPVDPDFSARFSCIRRKYKYFFPKGNLDIEIMKLAATKLHGEHDYRNFCKMDVANGVVNYKRNIHQTDIICTDQETDGYTMCELTVIGQAFLWHQIRCIVSVLFLIGQGKETPEIIDELLDIDKHPRKPQYTMAAELPLCLYDCEFVGIKWIYTSEWNEENIKHLQEQWTIHRVRSQMIRSMLRSVEKVHHDSEDTGSHPKIQSQTDSLLPGNKPKNYMPLLKRQKCESLEERIQHFAKRKKVSHDPQNKQTA